MSRADKRTQRYDQLQALLKEIEDTCCCGPAILNLRDAIKAVDMAFYREYHAGFVKLVASSNR